MSSKAPWGTRILRDDLDWESLTDDEVVAVREQVRRKRMSRPAQVVTGRADRRSRIEERMLDLPGRQVSVRVHRPRRAAPPLPLVLSFHGGGFVVGDAAQNDWLNSHLAAEGPAVVVALDYRLAPEHPLPAPLDDAVDTLARILDDAAAWGVDPRHVAVLGESAGGTLAALLALRARDAGTPLRAQVLTCPVTDWSDSMTDYPSVVGNGDRPGLSVPRLRAYRALSIRAGFDPRTVSPLLRDDLAGLPPALVVTGAMDPVRDHGSRYVDRLREAGTTASWSDHPRAVHGFLSMPGIVPAARPARQEIVAFVRDHLRTADVPASTDAR
jgi:acetyl esterase